MTAATDTIKRQANSESASEAPAQAASPTGEGSQSMSPPPARRRWLLPVGIVLVIAAIALGVPYYRHWRTHETTDNAAIEGHIIAMSPQVAGRVQAVHVVDNQIVAKGDLLVEIDPRDYEARLAAAKAALAAAEAKQQGATSNVDLTRITTAAGVSEAEASVEIAKSSVAAAQTQVAAAQSGLVAAKAQLASAEAAVQQAKAQVGVAQAEVTRADTDLKRFNALRGTNAVSQQEITQAEAASQGAHAKLTAAQEMVAAKTAEAAAMQASLQTANATIRQAEANLVQAQAAVGKAEATLAAARSAPQQVALTQAQAQGATADIEQTKAMVRQAELALSYTRIVAPEAGRVTRKNVEPGAYVQVGQNLLAIVPDKVWVVANFKETQLTHMRKGQEAEIHVDAYPNHSFKGEVDSIQAGTGARFSLLPPENATGNWVKVVQRVPVKIVFKQFPDEQRLLAPGMSVEAEVKVK